MMVVNLLRDYRGVLTGETYYTAGKYSIPGDMPEGHANALISAGHAVEVEVNPPVSPKPEPKAAPKVTVSKGRTKKAT